MDSVTQQQHDECTYDTCCLLAAEAPSCCVLYSSFRLISSAYLPRLLPPETRCTETRHDANPDGILFGHTVLPEAGLPSSDGGRTENDTRKWKPEKNNTCLGPIRMENRLFDPKNVQFRIEKRSYIKKGLNVDQIDHEISPSPPPKNKVVSRFLAREGCK